MKTLFEKRPAVLLSQSVMEPMKTSYLWVYVFSTPSKQSMQADQMDYFKSLFASDSASHTRGMRRGGNKP